MKATPSLLPVLLESVSRLSHAALVFGKVTTETERTLGANYPVRSRRIIRVIPAETSFRVSREQAVEDNVLSQV